MKTRFVEVTNGIQNWGKMMVGRFDESERTYFSRVAGVPLLDRIGISRADTLVFDLQTCEGALFQPRKGGDPVADLSKHRIWVCPMFDPFMAWLYANWNGELDALPETVDVGDVPIALAGYRRQGQEVGDPLYRSVMRLRDHIVKEKLSLPTQAAFAAEVAGMLTKILAVHGIREDS